jgi:dihydroflavonol-4-reductase
MIAVTGANGLLGSVLIRKFLEQNLPVTAIVRTDSDTRSLEEFNDRMTLRKADVLDVMALRDSFQGAAAVIHCAAAVSFNPRGKKRVFAVNVEGTRNVVDTCLTLGIPKLIHVSSVAALGRQKGFPEIDEEAKWVDSPLNSSYAESKYRAELEVFRGMEEGLSVSIINPSVILAPSDWNKSSSQLFHYVAQERMFYTDGSINYVDARDVADIIYRLYSGAGAGEKIIANAGAIELKSLLAEIARRLGKKEPSLRVSGGWLRAVVRLEEIRCLFSGREPVITRESARFATETFFYNNRKVKEELGFKFRELAETLDWCCDVYRRKINTNK